MHHATAAIMNNCQITSFTKKTFYGTTTSSIKIDEVNINGNKCIVKGSFETSVKVTDLIVRFYNSTETFLGGSSGYTSVAFVVKPTGNTFEAEIPINELAVQKFNYRIGVTALMENGNAKSASLPYTYVLVQNGSDYTLEREEIANNGWTVTTSHTPPKDDDIFNAPESLVDNNLSTCLSLVKPGKSYEGVSVDKNDIVYVIIDFKQQLSFNAITLTNRNFNAGLNTKAVSFYGKDNESDAWTEIKTKAALPDAKENTVTLPSTVKYRYLKMTYDEWDTKTGSTMQFAELAIKNIK